MDKTLKEKLIALAREHPLSARRILLSERRATLFRAAFGDDEKVERIIATTEKAKEPEPVGLIVFCYDEKARSLKPITDILDQVPGLEYGTLTLTDGTTLGFMAHGAAQDGLFSPLGMEGGNMYHSGGSLYRPIEDALKAKISERFSDPKISAAARAARRSMVRGLVKKNER